jgi:hypothetical protein
MGAFAVLMWSILGYNLFLKPYLQAKASCSWHPVQATVLYSQEKEGRSGGKKHPHTIYYLDLG